MARGRNQNRGRNQQIQNTQQLAKNFPLHQQQQHSQLLAKSATVQQQSNTNATNTTTTSSLTIAPVDNINKQQCNSQIKNSNKNITTSPSINSESYGHIDNNKTQSNNNYDDASILETNCGEDIKTHLEKYGDPATVSTTYTTYQMTMSNNSSENFRQVKQNDANDSHNEDHNNDVRSGNYSNSANESSTQTLQTRVNQKLLNSRENEEHSEHENMINRFPVIEQDGSVIASVTANNNETASNKCLTTTHNGQSVNGQLHEVTECARDRLLLKNKCEVDSPTAMGQKSTKGDIATSSSSFSSPSSSVRSFRESSAPLTPNENYAGNNNYQRGQSPSIHVPTITVVDCSSAGGNQSAKSYDSNKTDKEEFYDFEIETPERQFHQQQQPAEQYQEFSDHYNENKENHDYDVDANAAAVETQKTNTSYGIQRTASPTSMYSRYNYMKLEDVEEEDEEDQENEDEDDEEEDDEDCIDEEREQQNVYAPTSNNNLDNEYQTKHKHSNSHSPERQQHIKSTNININNSNNNSDCNLSASFPDSGMGESLASTTTNSRYININDSDSDDASTTMKQQQQQHNRAYTLHQKHLQQQQQQHGIPFVRDGNSTDCDETLMQCDELLLDFAESPDYLDPSSQRLVCIESISLPDVVVESTNSNGNNNVTTSTNNNAAASLSSSLSPSSTLHNSGVGDFININGATGATLNSVHFIPIHVEGNGSGSGGGGGGSGRSSPRKQCVDDSVVGSGRATIEIIEDVTELQQAPSSPLKTTKTNSDIIAEKLKNELLEQKAQFNVQLEDAQKNVNSLQTKIYEMQINIEKLEQELSAKTWNVERLQGELSAAHKDDEYVRKKLKLLEDEKTNLRHRFSENEDDLKRKYDDLEMQYNELQEKYKQTQSLAGNLHTQLAKAQAEAEEWREEVEKIRADLEEQIKILKSALENSENERKICEDKWQREFEMLRTHNMDREESIMTDCEWQLRQMQRKCKDKMEKTDFERREAVEKVEQLEEELEDRRKEIDDLKIYQAQVNSLRGVVNEQEHSIKNLMDKIEHLKSDLATANESLEEQIEAVKKIKYHCDNALYDKERQMMYRIDEVRNEAASFWEDKLYTEMTRLKNELESVYVEERREALDKLQAEHVEELKALTNRYSDNEEELRTELADTQECLQQKKQEFIELREKSDNTLLQTRMHLDRADREYQMAMCKEEERREALEASLRQEFESEKEEMEEKFRERLGQVKDEFAKELQINTQELSQEHEKEIAQLKAKLTAEKEVALQTLTEKHRKKLSDVEERIKEVEMRHKNDLKDLKAAYDAEKTALDKRDISNANEIEQLHRKCRCLTNLFEEMRMRYERRDPRPEDLREISELRTRCESQERDLYLLTDRLREMQIQMNELQQNGVECNTMNNKNNKKSKQIKKPPPKTIPTNCDVIYEENEERESPPPTQNSTYTNQQMNKTHKIYNNNNDNDEDEDDNEDDNEDDDSDDADANNTAKTDQSSYEGNVKLLIKNNVDDSHMITAV